MFGSVERVRVGVEDKIRKFKDSDGFDSSRGKKSKTKTKKVREDKRTRNDFD